jgi:hypothetical protein
VNAEWIERAACRGQDWSLFFDQAAGRAPRAVVEFCQHCPVRFECVAEGVELGDWDSLRGGMSGKKRRELRGVLVRMSRAGDAEGIERVSRMSRSEIVILRRKEAA